VSTAPAQDAPVVVQRLVREHGARWIDRANLGELLQAPVSVLFVVGDVVRHPEGLDVAVVLPELMRSFPERFVLGIARGADAEELAARFSVRAQPALLFFRAGAFVSAITGMHDWSVFVDKVRAALAAAASEVRHGLPVVAGSSSR
jgi:hydrogenase-1 operon protein HyaE